MIGTARALRLGAALATALAVGFAGAAAAADKNINIGWTAWSDAEAVTKMAKKLIEENYEGYTVEMTLADIAVQYQGVSKGDLDLMMMAWLPGTHADYMEQVAGDVIDRSEERRVGHAGVSTVRSRWAP